MTARIEAELALLRTRYAQVDHVEAKGLHWFRVEPLKTPAGWAPPAIPVTFSVTQGYPGVAPYGFYVPIGLSLNGAPPKEHPPPHPPPFEGAWRFLSWQAEGWRATANVKGGSNLWDWVRTFVRRFEEGR